MKPISGVAAGVPYVATPPERDRPGAATVLAWHLLDSPRTETAFAAALPLAGLDAWRVYLGLPMTGRRTPPGGVDEVLRLLGEDVVRNVHEPIVRQAVAEAGDALADLRTQLGAGTGPIGLLGGSLGAAVAQSVILDGALTVDAAVLVSPLVRLRPVIDAIVPAYTGQPYRWTPRAEAFAARLDFVQRAGAGGPPVLLVMGAQDEPWFRQPVHDLYDTLRARYADPSRVGLHVVEGMGHALANEPGVEPEPQTAHAAEVDRMAVDWFGRYLLAERR